MRRHLRMVLNVSFEGDRSEFLDDELEGVVMEELEGIVHRARGPRTTVLSSTVTEVDDDEWDPSPEDLVSDDEKKLAALEASGVDNWEGYDHAMHLLREEF